MANTIGIYYLAAGIETGGDNSLTGLTPEAAGATAQRVSYATELKPLIVDTVDTVYTAYFAVIDANGLDPVKDSGEDIGIDPPAGLSVCATSGGTFVTTNLDMGVPATGGLTPFYLKPTEAIVEADSLDGLLGAAGTPLGNFTFVTGTRCAAPTVTADTSAHLSIVWDWADVASADSYQIEVDTADTFATATRYAVATSTKTSSALTDGTTYYARARALDERGNGAWSATATAVARFGVLVDAGFEGRSDATSLDNTIWTDVGTPTKAEYDTAQKKNGDASAWVRSESGTTGVTAQTAVMTHDGAELRFWAYFENATDNSRFFDDADASADNANRAWLVRTDASGNLAVYTSKAGNPNGYTTNAYTNVSTYSAGWYEFRIVLNFTNDTYTLSNRTDATAAWTQLKASGATGYDIPMLSANDVTTTHGFRVRCTATAAVWVDDLRYQDGA